MRNAVSLPVQSRLVRNLLAGEFALTADMKPPASGSPDSILAQAAPLRECVNALNVRDTGGAHYQVSGLACAAVLAASGIEPILQFSCESRNRVAMLNDILGAAVLGIHNILILQSENQSAGGRTHRRRASDAAPAELIRLVSEMAEKGVLPSEGLKMTSGGILPSRYPIDAPPQFFIGTSDFPEMEPEKEWLAQLKPKAGAGAHFIQTQLCFDTAAIRRYISRLNDNGISGKMFALVSLALLPSHQTALWMRENYRGLHMPDEVIRRLRAASEPEQEGMRICAEMLQEISEISGVSGVHLVSPEHPELIAQAIEESGLKS
ncbi:MAG: methylenetetrahydrofolate reductase [bacterium]|nr:methylenetetrahydrofolate reductase [bacterium]